MGEWGGGPSCRERSDKIASMKGGRSVGVSESVVWRVVCDRAAKHMGAKASPLGSWQYRRNDVTWKLALQLRLPFAAPPPPPYTHIHTHAPPLSPPSSLPLPPGRPVRPGHQPRLPARVRHLLRQRLRHRVELGHTQGGRGGREGGGRSSPSGQVPMAKESSPRPKSRRLGRQQEDGGRGCATSYPCPRFGLVWAGNLVSTNPTAPSILS